MYKLNLEKAEEPEIKLPSSIESQKKRENSEKKKKTNHLLPLPSLTMLNLLTVVHNKLENFSRDGNTRPPYLPPEKLIRRSKSNN